MWRKGNMKPEPLTVEEVIAELKKDQGDLSLREYADTVGCTASYLSLVYNGKRQPTDRILSHLNIQRNTTYTRTGANTGRRWK